jgi:hypothetical protein
VRFGRKPKLSDYQRAEALERGNAGEPLADIARSCGVHLSNATVSPDTAIA